MPSSFGPRGFFTTLLFVLSCGFVSVFLNFAFWFTLSQFDSDISSSGAYFACAVLTSPIALAVSAIVANFRLPKQSPDPLLRTMVEELAEMKNRANQQEPWWHFHKQSLGEDYKLKWKWIHGRCWLRICEWRFRFEWHLWSRSCHTGIDFGGSEDQLLFSFAVPPVSLYFAIEISHSRCIAKWFPDQGRSMRLSLYKWTIRLVLWGREWEHRSADPWYVRGVSLDLKDFFLGRARYSTVETQPSLPVNIPLDGHLYEGIAKFERFTWKRPRWFAFSRDSVTINMNPGHGLPHSGKGENSWDCGDDALCGWDVNGCSLNEAINHGITTIEEYRKRYGNASRVGPIVSAAASPDNPFQAQAISLDKQ